MRTIVTGPNDCAGCTDLPGTCGCQSPTSPERGATFEPTAGYLARIRRSSRTGGTRSRRLSVQLGPAATIRAAVGLGVQLPDRPIAPPSVPARSVRRDRGRWRPASSAALLPSSRANARVEELPAERRHLDRANYSVDRAVCKLDLCSLV